MCKPHHLIGHESIDSATHAQDEAYAAQTSWVCMHSWARLLMHVGHLNVSWLLVLMRAAGA